MKKLLLSLAAMLLAFGVNAETQVLFDFDNDATALFGIEGRSDSNGGKGGDFIENGVATVDGVTMTVEASPEGTQNPNRLWVSSPVLRMYNGTFSVSAPGHNITKIVFTANDKFSIASVSAGTLEDKTWTTETAVSDVVFTIQKNTQLKTMTVTLDGELGSAPEPVVLAGTGEGTVESPYDVERALSVIANDVVASTPVYVKGEISEIEEISLEYGNATYIISQGEFSIKVYRGYGLGGEKFTSGLEIAEGDVVVVCGKLVTNYGGQITSGSSIYSINGETAPEEPEYVPVGNGTKENPYTVEDVQKMKIEESDGNHYWVKGYILGSASSATKLNDPENAVDTNIAIGETPDATSFVPVALPVGEFRTILGVATTPDNVGKEVVVLGTLEKYFGTAGVKDVVACVFDGHETSGIVNFDIENTPVKYYNAQGIEVANPVAGQLYIRVQGNKATKIIK